MPWHPPPPPNSDLRLRPRMDMPDSPRPPQPSSWSVGTQLPVSYRVAIAVDAVVLLTTILSLIGLGWYIRRQLQKRKDSLLHHHEAGYGFDSDDEDGGDVSLDLDGKAEEGMLVSSQRGERKKKGHVRWTSSVVGMGVFARMSVDEGKVKLEGGEGNKRWGYDSRNARKGGKYEMRGGERQTRVAAGQDGFRSN